MSSRALRRAQREREELKQKEQLHSELNDEESEEEQVAPAASQGPSMFALLGAQDDAQDQDEDEDEDDNEEEGDMQSEQKVVSTQHSISSKKKKKKKSKRQKENRVEASQTSQFDSHQVSQQLDEIDLALQDLSTQEPDRSSGRKEDSIITETAEQTELYKLLEIDTQHLHAANEMRKLFGRAALEGDDDEANQRRGPRQAGRAGLAAAVGGRNGPAGRNLASIGLRKNIFVQGKEEWPRATLGGLGMEIVERRKDGAIEYRFVHNSSYQDTQRQFQECVASMDPNRMVQLLQFNPSHISTLLQVSEIAKHERDRATAGDLIERALFAFGRAVHSTFSNSVHQGRARLDFRRPENREFWLAGWRYIAILGQRATWRTAFEWALLLLSLDPNHDPYCVSLVIDQLAVRARQPQRLIDMWNSRQFHSKWHRLPNVSMSIGLAYLQIKEHALAKAFLQDAIEQFPWVASRLCQELDLQPIPASVWGKTARSDTENLFTELYVTKAKDIWNTPESTGLLMELAMRADPKSSPDVSIYTDFDELDYGRHVLLTDDQNLIGMLDRRISSRLASISDPLPPKDEVTSYSLAQPATRGSATNRSLGSAEEMLSELNTLQVFFQSLLPWFPRPDANTAAPEQVEMPSPQDLQRRMQESGVDPETILQRAARMQQLQHGIQRLVEDTDDAEELEAARQINDRAE